jgi:hypothetical protein
LTEVEVVKEDSVQKDSSAFLIDTSRPGAAFSQFNCVTPYKYSDLGDRMLPEWTFFDKSQLELMTRDPYV